MSAIPAAALIDHNRPTNEMLYAIIAADLERDGYSIQHAAMPVELTEVLIAYQREMDARQFIPAGIGRGEDFQQRESVRTDAICWITGASVAGQQWLAWAAACQQYLNRQLFLGLFSFESHFAYYQPGDYYLRHYDAFLGEANRVLSMVLYLNPDWSTQDGGELVLYRCDEDQQGIRVLPELGTLVVFLSEAFPHEVLPARRDRHSIAGWFRVNTSVTDRVDPPR